MDKLKSLQDNMFGQSKREPSTSQQLHTINEVTAPTKPRNAYQNIPLKKQFQTSAAKPAIKPLDDVQVNIPQPLVQPKQPNRRLSTKPIDAVPTSVPEPRVPAPKQVERRLSTKPIDAVPINIPQPQLPAPKPVVRSPELRKMPTRIESTVSQSQNTSP